MSSQFLTGQQPNSQPHNVFRLKTAQVSVFCVPVIVPLLQARLQVQQANSDDWCSSGNADQQQRSHLLKPPKPFIVMTFARDKKFITGSSIRHRTVGQGAHHGCQ